MCVRVCVRRLPWIWEVMHGVIPSRFRINKSLGNQSRPSRRNTRQFEQVAWDEIARYVPESAWKYLALSCRINALTESPAWLRVEMKFLRRFSRMSSPPSRSESSQSTCTHKAWQKRQHRAFESRNRFAHGREGRKTLRRLPHLFAGKLERAWTLGTVRSEQTPQAGPRA